MNKEFKECSSCSKKAGSPELCSACIHNRTLVMELRNEIFRLESKLEIITKVVELT